MILEIHFGAKKIRVNYVSTLFGNGSKDLASSMKTNKSAVETSIKKTINALKE